MRSVVDRNVVMRHMPVSVSGDIHIKLEDTIRSL